MRLSLLQLGLIACVGVMLTDSSEAGDRRFRLLSRLRGPQVTQRHCVPNPCQPQASECTTVIVDRQGPSERDPDTEPSLAAGYYGYIHPWPTPPPAGYPRPYLCHESLPELIICLTKYAECAGVTIDPDTHIYTSYTANACPNCVPCVPESPPEPAIPGREGPEFRLQKYRVTFRYQCCQGGCLKTVCKTVEESFPAGFPEALIDEVLTSLGRTLSSEVGAAHCCCNLPELCQFTYCKVGAPIATNCGCR